MQTLADAPRGAGGTWNRNGVILFAPTRGLLFRVSQVGGAVTAVTRVEGPDERHVSPQFLPDGRHFLFFSGGVPKVQGVYVADLAGQDPPRRVLADAEASAVYVASGHLLFPRQGTLLAQRFDAERMTLVGEPWQVSDSVRVDLIQGLTVLSASDVGSIVYRPEDFEVIERRLVWLDRTGKELQRLDDGDPINTNNMALSPTGDRLVVRRGRTSGIWLVDTDRRLLTQLSERLFTYPLWSPDGNSLIFTSTRDGTPDLFQRTLTGPADELLFTTPGSPAAHDWSPDGRLLLHRDVDPRTGFDLWVQSIEREGAGLKPASGQKPIPVAQTLSTEMNGQFSPDGSWIAYESDESGRFEIYVQPFGRQGSRERVSVDGGSQARWRRDGRELYYIAPDGRLMAVPILRSSTNLRIDIGAPVSLFTVRVATGTNNPYQYVVSPDGQRFLVNMVTDTSPGVVSAIVNWAPAHRESARLLDQLKHVEKAS